MLVYPTGKLYLQGRRYSIPVCKKWPKIHWEDPEERQKAMKPLVGRQNTIFLWKDWPNLTLEEGNWCYLWNPIGLLVVWNESNYKNQYNTSEGTRSGRKEARSIQDIQLGDGGRRIREGIMWKCLSLHFVYPSISIAAATLEGSYI